MAGGTKIVTLEKVEKGGSPGNAVTAPRRPEAAEKRKLRRMIASN